MLAVAGSIYTIFVKRGHNCTRSIVLKIVVLKKNCKFTDCRQNDLAHYRVKGTCTPNTYLYICFTSTPIPKCQFFVEPFVIKLWYLILL